MPKTRNGIFEKVEYDELSSIQIFLNTEPTDFPLHWHSAMEIIMPLENTFAVSMNKMAYSIQVGEILFIPPGELHEAYAPLTGSRIVMQFDSNLLSNVKSFSAILPVLLQPRIVTQANAPDLYKAEKELLLQIYEEFIANNPLREASIYSMIIQMFVLIGRNHMDSDTLFPMVRIGKQKEYIEKFNMVFDYIDQNYTEDLSLEAVSGVAGFSKFHFSRLFKQFTDMSFYDYLNQRRVRAAELLLLDPDVPITEIAMQSGFSSISTFNRVFKAFKKCTPTEFKKLYQTKRSSIAEWKIEE